MKKISSIIVDVKNIYYAVKLPDAVCKVHKLFKLTTIKTLTIKQEFMYKLLFHSKKGAALRATPFFPAVSMDSCLYLQNIPVGSTCCFMKLSLYKLTV